MKTRLLALAQSNLANANTNADVALALVTAITALPDDPIPAPTGFRISRTYGDNVDSPISAEFQWMLQAGTPVLEYKGAPGNPNGPQEWTELPVNGAGAGPNGELATITVQQRTQQTILFRVRATLNGGYSEPATIQFSTPENLPEALAS